MTVVMSVMAAKVVAAKVVATAAVAVHDDSGGDSEWC
jgi:hypothetical protein